MLYCLSSIGRFVRSSKPYMVEVEHDGQKLSIDMLLLALEIVDSLSIRRFWGKGERWKRKRERSEGEKRLTQMLLL